MGRGGGTSISVFVSNLRLLGCFLLVYFGGVVFLVVLVLVVLVVTGGKQCQLLVLGLQKLKPKRST